MKYIFYIFVIFYVIYHVNKFLSRFYFQKFDNVQKDMMAEMLKRQQRQYESEKRREGEINIVNLNKKENKNSPNVSGGDYIDYEVVK